MEVVVISLNDYLQNLGYRRVALGRNGVGHFEIEGTLNDRPVVVLLDTGAASTIVSLELVQEMGLSTTKLDAMGGGAGAARMEIYQISDAQLLLGDVVPCYKALLAMDLSHVKAALALRETRSPDVILGVDVFDAQAAIIDYGGNSLFLRA